MAQAAGPVLVVDDDADSRAFVALVLRMHGFEVVTASDGEEALETASNRRPSLIVLDLMMPGMDGVAFREEQLRRPELAGIPVLVTTALPDQAQVRQRLGSIPSVSKPIDIDKLIDQVVALCRPGASR